MVFFFSITTCLTLRGERSRTLLLFSKFDLATSHILVFFFFFALSKGRDSHTHIQQKKKKEEEGAVTVSPFLQFIPPSRFLPHIFLLCFFFFIYMVAVCFPSSFFFFCPLLSPSLPFLFRFTVSFLFLSLSLCVFFFFLRETWRTRMWQVFYLEKKKGAKYQESESACIFFLFVCLSVLTQVLLTLPFFRM